MKIERFSISGFHSTGIFRLLQFEIRGSFHTSSWVPHHPTHFWIPGIFRLLQFEDRSTSSWFPIIPPIPAMKRSSKTHTNQSHFISKHPRMNWIYLIMIKFLFFPNEDGTYGIERKKFKEGDMVFHRMDERLRTLFRYLLMNGDWLVKNEYLDESLWELIKVVDGN